MPFVDDAQLLVQLEASSEEASLSHPSSAPKLRPETVSSESRFSWKFVVPIVLGVITAGIIGWYQIFDQEPEGSSGTVIVAGHEFEYSADATVTRCTGMMDPREDVSQVKLVNQSRRTITAKWAVINMTDLYSIDVDPGESNAVTPMRGNELCIFDAETSEEIVSFQILEEKHSVEVSE